jgi:transcription initiation factor TFIIIB Brf1 subunit/transcription initiation factor TFIIB
MTTTPMSVCPHCTARLTRHEVQRNVCASCGEVLDRRQAHTKDERRKDGKDPRRQRPL